MNPHIKSILVSSLLVLLGAHAAQADSITAGTSHSAVVTAAGVTWTWGANVQGQLGDASSGRSLPGLVNNLTNVVAVAAGQYHTLVLLGDGTVRAWGYNQFGQLGDGTTTNRTSPVVVIGLSNVVAIAAGRWHSLAQTSDGHIWTWGDNSYGELGDGTTTRSLQPLLVPNFTSVSAIGAGTYHTLAVKSDGTVWAWGRNGNGQLGDGTLTQRNSPTQMTGVSGAAAVAGGDIHSIVLKADGTVSAVGGNSSGQLGDGTTTQRTSAVSTGLSSVTSIEAGFSHSIARKSDGTLWAWGDNSYGELGDATTTMRKTPVQVLNVSDVTLIAAGDYHTLAVTSTGIVWSWGMNSSGILGDGTTQNRSTPDTISAANYAWKIGTPTFSVAPGTYSAVQNVTITSATPSAEIHYTLSGVDPTQTDAVVTSGVPVVVDRSATLKARAWLTGSTTSSVASGVYTLVVSIPTIAPSTGTYTLPQTVSMSSATAGTTIRYTTNGTAPTSSSPIYSQPISVGTTTTLNAAGFRDGWTTSTPRSAALTMNFGTLDPPTLSPAGATYTNAVDVTLASDVSTATIRYTLDGSTPTTSSPVYTAPIHVTAGLTIKAKAFHPDFTTSAQSQATYAITLAAPTISPTSGTYAISQLITVTPPVTGTTVTYTVNGVEPTSNDPVVPASGTLPIGNFVLKVKAFKTGATTSPTATADYAVTGTLTSGLLAAGEQFSLAVRPDGVSFSWGYNFYGQLGNGTLTNSVAPSNVSGLTGVTSIAAGQRHAVAVVAGGTVYSWGYNGDGRLGDGTTTQRTLPTFVPALTAASVAAGRDHTLAVATDGRLWAWGYNGYGQLGDGTTQTRLSPVQLSTPTNVSKVAGGSTFSIALRTDGTVWSWGDNGYGQLATGNTTARATPGQISGLSTATAIAVGDSHVLALLADGTVRAWGNNGSGRLGDGTITQRTSPVTVSGLTSVAAIAVGYDYSLALKTDGTVWAWGTNGYGQLGDGTTAGHYTAAQVPGLPQIQAIAAGGGQSLALATDGSVWAWGRNTNGQVGDSTTLQRTSPVRIANAGMAWMLPNVSFILTWQQQTDAAAPVQWTYGYDAADRLTSAVKATTGGTPTILSRYGYAYDAAGNRTTEQIGDAVTGVTADRVNRLVSQQPSGLMRVAGQLDEAGTVTLNGTPASVDASNRFEALTPVGQGPNVLTVVARDAAGNPATKIYDLDSTGGIKTFAYDANGNLASDGTRTFEWDAEDRLVAVTIGTHRSEFTYDGLDRRVRIVEKENGGTLRDANLFWDWTNIIEERLSTGEVNHFFAEGEQHNGLAPYVVRDHLGSVREVTDAAGTIVTRNDYDPYGRVTRVGGTEDSRFGFTGHMAHAPSGLALAVYRAYDPSLGRWLSEDPIGLAGGINLDEYVGSSPITFIDPDGLDSTNWNNTQGGRSRWNGPTNGNWGGRCWSGGQYSCNGNPMGNAPPTDSGDACYMRHDNCYASCGGNAQCMAACDQRLVRELDQLPDDPRRWPQPPRPGTEGDTRRYRDAAHRYFK